MQVIGLVNTLLAKDRQCLHRRLHQQRYTVIPLAPDVGLIGWMARTKPLQQLVTDYRKNHHILSDLEHQMILKVGNLLWYRTSDPLTVSVRRNPVTTWIRVSPWPVNWKYLNQS